MKFSYITARLASLLVMMSLMSITMGAANDVYSSVASGQCGTRPIDLQHVFGQARYNTIPDALTDLPSAPRLQENKKLNKIVGGKTAIHGEYPWQARINLLTQNGYVLTEHWCGAVIINEHWLLSAAHCFEQKDLYKALVIVGDHRRTMRDAGEQTFFVKKTILHEKYERNDNDIDNDIALLRVLPTKDGRGIKFNKYVQPVCLPDQRTRAADNTRCLISGWGALISGNKRPPVTLQAATVSLINQQLCKQQYMYSYRSRIVRDTMICAGDMDGGIDSCQGDSGGPLVCKTGDVYTLFGITSWGHECARKGFPGVYTRVAEYRSWIDLKLARE